jgi:hypothetical protein
MQKVLNSTINALILLLAVLKTVYSAPPLIGVHISETDITQYKRKIDKAAALHIKVVRIPVDWNVLEPSKNHYNTAYINEIKARVLHIQRKNMKAVLMLGQSPFWASDNENPSFPPKPVHYQAYANTMRYLHTVLISPDGNNTVRKNTILAWEVWNEPNVVEFWGTKPVRAGTYVLVDLAAASEYAALLEKCYTTMKSSFRDITILGGSLASADTAYLQALYDAWNGDAKFDHLSLHPYSRVDENDGSNYGKTQYPDQCNRNDTLSPPWCFKQGVENIRALLNSYGDTKKEIWFTEFGTSSSDGWGEAGSETAQMEYIRRALNIVDEWYTNNDAMKIPVAIIYRLKDEEGDFYGLYRNDFSMKPVAYEVRRRLQTNGRLINNVKFSLLSIIYMLLAQE